MIILFDDIFGWYDEDVLMIIVWYLRMKKFEELSKRVFFILILREDIYF